MKFRLKNKALLFLFYPNVVVFIEKNMFEIVQNRNLMSVSKMSVGKRACYRERYLYR